MAQRGEPGCCVGDCGILGVHSRHCHGPGSGPRAIEIIAAGVGLLVVALEIAYLPALYDAFSTRETEVTLLATRAGTPAWGPEILARHQVLDSIDELPPLYADWERWAAAVSESHTNYPALIWFRSPVPSRSWLLSLVAMMDSAALYHAVSPSQTPRQARLCLSMGTNCLRSMAGVLKIPFDPDPIPTAGTRLTKEEFARGFERLTDVHFPLERNLDDAVAPLPGVAHQLRVDRRRPDQADHAASGPLVPPPSRAGADRVARRA